MRGCRACLPGCVIETTIEVVVRERSKILPALDLYTQEFIAICHQCNIQTLPRLVGLRTGDEQSNCWRIFLRTEKSGKPVFLRVPEEMKLALDAVPAPRGVEAGCKYFFWNGHTSERAMKGIVERMLAAVFVESEVPRAHAHRFRHTLATELLGKGATFEDVADILGNSPEVVRKHYAKWSPGRQARIDALMTAAYCIETNIDGGTKWVQEENRPVIN